MNEKLKFGLVLWILIFVVFFSFALLYSFFILIYSGDTTTYYLTVERVTNPESLTALVKKNTQADLEEFSLLLTTLETFLLNENNSQEIKQLSGEELELYIQLFNDIDAPTHVFFVNMTFKLSVGKKIS
ncbi:MAG: hypothetical protein ACXACK_17745 [Candidatus Hodarchaeales archaeon]